MRKQVSRTESAPSVGTLARGLDILELFAAETPELTQKEVSQRLSLPVPTVHRLTKLLMERGWLVRDPGSPPAAARARRGAPAAGAPVRPEPPELARDHLRAMAERSGETVNLAVLQGGEVVYLVSESGSRLLTLRSSLGLRLPVHCTALGKCLLAQLPPTRRAGWRARSRTRRSRRAQSRPGRRWARAWSASAARGSRCRTRSTRRGSTRSPCRSRGPGATGRWR